MTTELLKILAIISAAGWLVYFYFKLSKRMHYIIGRVRKLEKTSNESSAVLMATLVMIRDGGVDTYEFKRFIDTFQKIHGLNQPTEKLK